MHLVQHLVRVLDEVLEPLQERDGEPVRPDHEAGVAVELENLVEHLEVLGGVVEELVSVRERRRLGDHVQEVELGHPQRDRQLHDLVQHADVLLVDDDVDVADDSPVGLRAPDPRDHAVERARGSREVVVQLGGVPVEAPRDLAQTRLHRLLVELGQGQEPAVRHGLHAVVADRPPVADEVHELGVQRGLAAADDDLVGPSLLDPAAQIRAHVVRGEEQVPGGVAVEAEQAPAVARGDRPDPVLGAVGDAFALQHVLVQRPTHGKEGSSTSGAILRIRSSRPAGGSAVAVIAVSRRTRCSSSSEKVASGARSATISTRANSRRSDSRSSSAASG